MKEKNTEELLATINFYKQMEEEYRAIFEYSYDGIFISDGNGKVV